MKMKYFIIFLICIIVLAGSEYLFLNELGNQQRFLILLLSVVVATTSIIAIFLCYRRLRKEV